MITIKDRVNQLCSLMGFDRFELDINRLAPEQQAQLLALPAKYAPCRIKLQPNAKSSAYGQMWEYAVVCGYTQTADGVKALVIFTERESVERSDDFAFVTVNQIKGYRPERVRELVLTRSK